MYGPGLFESVYEEILDYELQQTGLFVERQKPIPVIHNELKMESGFRADLVIDRKVIVEIKSVEELAKVHYKQVITYLKLTNCKLGLLINFNVDLLKDGFHRVVNQL
ncbi:MAG: GxxExxY protein [Chitinophagaceae bacterium]|jgi:GxxExxY protein